MKALSETEILELLARLLRGEGNDVEVGEWLEQLERSIPCPHIQDLVRNSGEVDSPEIILRQARQHQTIKL